MRKFTNCWLNKVCPLPYMKVLLSFIVYKRTRVCKLAILLSLAIVLEDECQVYLCYTLVKLKSLYRGEDDTYAKRYFETIR